MDEPIATASPQEPRGFALMLAASFIAAGFGPAMLLLSFALHSWTFVDGPNFFSSSLYAIGIWGILVLVAYVRYEKKWRWFLIGAPFALYMPFGWVAIVLACALFGKCP